MNTFSGTAGMVVTIGSSPLMVSALGRWVVSGNTQTHVLRIVDAVTGYGMPGGATTANTSGARANAFTYGSLTTPITLLAGHTYYFVTTETAGGDNFLSDNTAITTASVGSATNAIFCNFASAPGSPVNWQIVGSPNVSYGAVDFIYTVGGTQETTQIVANTYAPIEGVGFPFPFFTGLEVRFSDPTFRPALTGAPPIAAPTLQGNVVSGTINLTGTFAYGPGGGGPAPGTGTLTMQLLIDGVPNGPYFTAPPFNVNFDTTTIPDGTHVITARTVDSSNFHTNGLTAWNLQPVPMIILVQNHGSLDGAQTIPICGWTAGTFQTRPFSPVPDFVHYPGPSALPLHNTVYAYPTKTIAPSSSASLRNCGVAGAPSGNQTSTYPGNPWYVESVCQTLSDQYYGDPQFCTTQSGGVFAQWFLQQEAPVNTVQAYPVVRLFPTYSGGRQDQMVSVFSTYVEFPASSGVTAWLGVDLTGQIYRLSHTGLSTTLAGVAMDRSQLWWDWTDVRITVAQAASKQIQYGTKNFTNWAGLNDVCFDPRDSTGNTIFVVNQVWNFIFKVTNLLSSPVATLYAGVESMTGGYVDGAAIGHAQFNSPSSIIMADGSGVDAAGTMYVCDSENSAIRKISADGSTVSTLVGQQPGPSTAQDNNTVSYAMTAMTWSMTGGGTATITMPSATIIGTTNAGPTVSGIGYTVTISGATNTGSGGAGLVNGSFQINGFTDSQHFTIPMPATAGQIGSIGVGSATLTAYYADFYSTPATIPYSQVYWCGVNCIRFTSTGLIVAGEYDTSNIRLINLAAGTVGKITTVNRNENYVPHLASFIWLDVDKAGTCGPVDDVLIASGTEIYWRTNLNGSWSQRWTDEWAPIAESAGAAGYPWMVACSRTEGRMIINGVAYEGSPDHWRIAQPGDSLFLPANVDFQAYNRGYRIWERGTTPAFPWGSRPTLVSAGGARGVSHLNIGPTFDDVMTLYPSDTALGTFIQNGYGLATPRPEITGNDLADLIYFIRRSSLLGSGVPNNTTLLPERAAYNTDINGPRITNVVTTRLSSTSINFTWTTDKPALGMVCCGSPNDAGSGSPYNVFSAFETSYVTSHNVTVTGLSTLTPTHFTILQKDVSGNSTYTLDATAGAGTGAHPTAITATPVAAAIPYNSPAGTMIAIVSVTMSDGSAFSGTLTLSDTSGFFAVSGMHIVTGRQLTAADSGAHSTTITATQGTGMVAMTVTMSL